MGRATPPFWAGRRVFVTGAATPAGRELVDALLARRAAVVALVGRNESLDRPVAVVRGRADDHARLTTALVLHDIDTVVHLAGGRAMLSAARLAGGLPVAVPPVASTDPVADLLWRAEALAAA